MLPSLVDPSAQAGKAEVSVAETEVGMAEVSTRIHDEGGEIYLPAEQSGQV